MLEGQAVDLGTEWAPEEAVDGKRLIAWRRQRDGITFRVEARFVVPPGYQLPRYFAMYAQAITSTRTVESFVGIADDTDGWGDDPTIRTRWLDKVFAARALADSWDKQDLTFLT